MLYLDKATTCLLDKATTTTLQQKLQGGTYIKRRRKAMGGHILLKPNNLEGREVRLKRPINATSAKCYICCPKSSPKKAPRPSWLLLNICSHFFFK